MSINQIIDNLRQKYAPDKRVALFNAEVLQEGETTKVTGETNLPAAREELLQQLKESNFKGEINIRLLPAAELNGKTAALVNISVANLRSNPKHAAELATQATLGTPLNVLKQQENWFLVQTPDQYIAWVDAGGIQLMTPKELAHWRNAERIIYKGFYGFSFSKADKESQTVSDVVNGDVFKVIEKKKSFFKVEYPDHRTAFLPADDCIALPQWLTGAKANKEKLVASARLLMGVPYLWGGTSFKGVDCSGFTKTAYFLNGLLLPRDASQQVHLGELVDTSKGFDLLQPGDLLFFGIPATDSTPEKVVHVAMWLGNMEFIHASGMVKVNSFDPAAPNYNEYELKRFLRAKRLLNHIKAVENLGY